MEFILTSCWLWDSFPSLISWFFFSNELYSIYLLDINGCWSQCWVSFVFVACLLLLISFKSDCGMRFTSTLLPYVVVFPLITYLVLLNWMGIYPRCCLFGCVIRLTSTSHCTSDDRLSWNSGLLQSSLSYCPQMAHSILVTEPTCRSNSAQQRG